MLTLVDESATMLEFVLMFDPLGENGGRLFTARGQWSVAQHLCRVIYIFLRQDDNNVTTRCTGIWHEEARDKKRLRTGWWDTPQML